MRIHHLSCATMCPWWYRSAAGLCARCLVIETEGGLVLCDTGLGIEDVAAPLGRLGPVFVGGMRPVLDARATARRQIERLGHSARDVRHVVLTHLDVDHAGGLADFPDAEVHVLAREHADALAQRPRDRIRYRLAHWAHGPRWVLHEPEGEPWNGFTGVRAIAALGPDLLLVPLAGHTFGHAGIAVRSPEGWLLHAGDAYFFRDELSRPPRCPSALTAFQRAVRMDRAAWSHNRSRLRDLAAQGEVRIFCAHDPAELL